jgi:phosphoribosylanthranilate isomerase
MKIKVCGMRNRSNIEELVRLEPDYIGFIFYSISKRFMGCQIPEDVLALIPDNIKKVGVFVNEPFDNLLELIRGNRLELVQLHGNETPGYCERLKKLGISVIRAFGISSDFDFRAIKPYDRYCDYFLFDTLSGSPGGSGLKFDWRKLGQYHEDKPFFLSGGIQSTDIENINQIRHARLHAIDLNSGFEIEAGIKDIPKLKSFTDSIRDQPGS